MLTDSDSVIVTVIHTYIYFTHTMSAPVKPGKRACRKTCMFKQQTPLTGHQAPLEYKGKRCENRQSNTRTRAMSREKWCLGPEFIILEQRETTVCLAEYSVGYRLRLRNVALCLL